MSEKVVSLVQPTAVEGNSVAIEALENMLVSAKEGKIYAVAVVAVDAENMTHTCFHTAGKTNILLGSISHLQHRLMKHMDGDE